MLTTRGPFARSNPDATSDYQTSISLYAPNGSVYLVELHFANLGGGTWLVSAMHSVGLLGQVRLSFDADGSLGFALSEAMRAPWDETGEQTWSLRFNRQTRSLPAESSVDRVEQDGLPPGGLVGLAMSARGEVHAIYDRRESISWWILDGVEGWLRPVE